MRKVACILFICTVLGCNIYAQTDTKVKIDPTEITLASDKSFKWHAWEKAPDGIKTASKYIDHYSHGTLFEFCETWVGNGDVRIAALDLNGNGVFGLAVSVQGKKCCEDNSCPFEIFDDGGKFTIWLGTAECNIRPSKNGVITSSGKLFQFVTNEELRLSEELNLKANQSMKYFVYRNNVEAPVVLRATSQEILAAKVHDDSLKIATMREMAETRSSVNENTLKAGEAATNAKVLNVDKLFPFSDGVARVQKGNSFALIDAAGNDIIPFNKYNILTNSKSNLLVVSEKSANNKYGLINSSGKLVLPCIYDNQYFKIDNDGYAYVSMSKPGFFINAKGNKIVFSPPSGAAGYFNTEVFSETLALFSDNQSHRYGYINHAGSIIITPQFDNAEPFSEGLAVVGKKDEFGVMKYGFINKTGKVVIPLEYSIKPHNFQSGFALVEPLRKDEFKYAYIDKEGKITIKLNKAPNGGDLSFFDIHHTGFTKGFSEWRSSKRLVEPLDYYLVDSLGNFKTLGQYLEPLHIEIEKLFSWPGLVSAKTGYLVFYEKGGVRRGGILDLNRKKKLFVINNIVIDGSYDPVSKLLLTRINFDDRTKKFTREGYMNEEGVYVIVKGQGDQW